MNLTLKLQNYGRHSTLLITDVAPEAMPWLQDQIFMALAWGAPDLGHGLEKCTDTFLHHLKLKAPELLLDTNKIT